MRYLVIIFRLCNLASTFIYALPIVALLRTSSKVSPLSSTSDSAETWFCRMVSLMFDSLSFWHRVKLDENAKTGSPLPSSSSKFIVICEFAFNQVAGSLSQSSMHAFFTDDRIFQWIKNISGTSLHKTVRQVLFDKDAFLYRLWTVWDVLSR